MRSYLYNPIKRKQYIMFFGDIVLLSLAALGSYGIFFVCKGKSIYKIQEQIWVLFIYVPPTLFMFYIFETYDFERILTLPKILVKITLAVFLSFGILSIIFYFFPSSFLGRVAFVINILLAILFVFFWRIIFLKLLRPLKTKKNILIIGNGHLPDALNSEINNHFSDQINILPNIGSLKEPYESDIRILDSHFHNPDIDWIVISSTNNLPPQILDRVLQSKLQGVRVYSAHAFYESLLGKIPINYMKDSWFLCDSKTVFSMSPIYSKIKRIIDIHLSLAGIILSLPIFILAIIAIKLTSRGPVFFVQERLGINQKAFKLIKFRTMKKDAEKDTGPVWAKKNDQRITFVGKILRKLRIDEIPQFLNILLGHMSFVGPRPIRKCFASQLAEEVSFYPLRFLVKPGLTGWAQVRCNYPDTKESQLEKLQYDMFYIQHSSPFLDTIIFIKTIQTILFRHGS